MTNRLVHGDGHHGIISMHAAAQFSRACAFLFGRGAFSAWRATDGREAKSKVRPSVHE